MIKKHILCPCFVLFSALFIWGVFASPALAQTSKADYYRGLDLYHAGDYEGARKAFETQLEKTPDDASVKQWLGLARERAETSPAPAVSPPALSLPAVSLPNPSNGSNPPAAIAAVPVAASAPQAPQAESWSEPTPAPAPAKPTAPVKAVTSSSDATEDDYEKGISLYLSGDYENSIKAFNRYLQANPGHIATQQWITLVKALVPGSGGGTKKVPTEERVVVRAAPAPPAPKPQSVTKPARQTPPVPPAPPVRQAPAPASEPLPKRPDVLIASTPEKSKDPMVAELREEIIDLKNFQAELQEKLAQTERQRTESEDENTRLSDELTESKQVAERAIEQTKKALTVSGAAAAEDQQKLRADLDNALSELERANAELQRKDTEIARLNAELKRARLAPAVPADKVRALEAKLSDAQKGLAALTNNYRLSEDSRNAAEKDLLALMQEKQKLEREAAGTKAAAQELRGLRAKLTDSDRALAQAKLRYETAEQARATAEKKILQLVQEEAQARRGADELGKVQTALESSRQQNLRLASDLQSERTQREALASELDGAVKREAETRQKLQDLRRQVNLTLSSLQEEASDSASADPAGSAGSL